MTDSAPLNPDHVLIRQFLERPEQPVSLDSCELATLLRAKIVTFDASTGSLGLVFDPPASLLQGMGVLQGGIVSGMLDFAMALATLARLPLNRACATVSMNVNFIRPARLMRYRAVAQPDRLGKSLAFVKAQLLAEEDNSLVATATSTLALADRG